MKFKAGTYALAKLIGTRREQPPYHFKVLRGEVRLPVREVFQQVCAENRVELIDGVLPNDHVHLFVSIPPNLSVSDFMRKAKGRSSHKVQREFPALMKRYWGRHFWARGYFCATAGAITEDVVLQYLETHIQNTTGISR